MDKKKTVLIVDDNTINRKVLEKILEEGYSTIEAEDGQAAMYLMNQYENKISAVMLDLVMPKMDGYEFLKIINGDNQFANIPVIVTTGNSNNENEIRALELGAWDFISKPYNAKIIKFRLKNAIERSQLAAFQQLKYFAEFDPLTGIYNKTKFLAKTREMLDETKNLPFAFIRFDIDRFQLVNSFFGKGEGDKLLKYIAKGVKELMDEFCEGVCGRIESDIFCWCAPYQKLQTETAIEKIRGLLSQYNSNYDIVPSFGIYVIDDITISIETMLDRAALAAKRCKDSYIEFYNYYDEAMSEELKKIQEITNEMNNALEENQFEIYFQPKYNLQENTVVGAEALVRWKHPQKGIISQGEFIPIFEKNGFISKLDYYVWEKTCMQLRKWIDLGKNPKPISVNVSRVDLYNPKLVELIIDLVKKYDISPELLNLELTESAYTDNPVAMRDTMTKLQEQGFIVMMDDFGSGYSSLNILKDIAVDVLKIDIEFFSKTEIDGRGENIIASVVRMAKWLDITVIAEGIETKQQVDFLRSIGCKYVQGYYFAQPMSILDYEKLMDKEDEFENKMDEDADSFSKNFLWTSNPQMEMLFTNMFQPVIFCEFENNHIELLRVNNAFYEMFGYDDSSVIRNNPIEVVDESYRNTVLDTFSLAAESKDTAECEYVRHRADDSLLWIGIKLKYINKVGDKCILMGSLTDVTMQKEFDKVLNYKL